jgi:hypothetical protein
VGDSRSRCLAHKGSGGYCIAHRGSGPSRAVVQNIGDEVLRRRAGGGRGQDQRGLFGVPELYGRRVESCEARGGVSPAGAALMAANCHGGELTRDGLRAKFRRAQGRGPGPECSESIPGARRGFRGALGGLWRDRTAGPRRSRGCDAAEQAEVAAALGRWRRLRRLGLGFRGVWGSYL